MRTSHAMIVLRYAALCCATILAPAASAAPSGSNAAPQAPRTPLMNIVFLDDGAEGLPTGAAVRHNHWPEWDARLPTFQSLLRTFIADFHKAQGQQPTKEASLYALEVSATIGAAERDRHITEALEAIAKATARPSFVLARSTAGHDQLRLVYVFEADCTPPQAARFLAALAEVAPPVFLGRIGERFGPFRAPPTVVFDPRATALLPAIADNKARHRWALLEEDAYLLPHYVLHTVAALHESPLTEMPWLLDRSVEPGQKIAKLDQLLQEVQHLRNTGGIINNWKANFIGNRAVELAEAIASMPGGMHNLSRLTPDQLSILRRETNRVGDFNQRMGRRVADLTTLVGLGVTTGGAFTKNPFAAAGGAALVVGGDKFDDWSNFHRQFQQAFENWYNNNPSRQVETSTRLPGSVGGQDFRENSQGLRSLEQELALRQAGPIIEQHSNPIHRMLKQSRQDTFGDVFGGFSRGSGSLPDEVGGILFEHDNDYRIDISGRLAREVAGDLRGRRGVAMGMLRYFDDVPLVWLDVAASGDGSLPVAVPRFLIAAGVDAWPRFGGSWSFEPLTLEVGRDGQGRVIRAKLTPTETLTPMTYVAYDAGVEGAPPLMVLRSGTGFEPALEVQQDGRFVWTLRHGVRIEFGAHGAVEAIASPHGHRVAYVREARRLVGQRTSDNRRIDIRYHDELPKVISVAGERRAAYEYDAGQKLVEVRCDRATWSISYAPNGRPRRIASADRGTLSLGHDEKGRLVSIESGRLTLGIQYLEGTNTLRLSGATVPAMDWLLGPISGPVMPDRAVLLTRNSTTGRIIQVSKGPVQGGGDVREFIPKEIIELVRGEPATAAASQ